MMIELSTANRQWFEEALAAYMKEMPFQLEDAYPLGITEKDLVSLGSLARFMRKKKQMSMMECKKLADKALEKAGIVSPGLFSQLVQAAQLAKKFKRKWKVIRENDHTFHVRP